MATTEVHTEQEDMWIALFDDNHADLALVAEMLLDRHLSPEIILRRAGTYLESSRSKVTFGAAIRAVVETAIQYNHDTDNSPLEASAPIPAKLRIPELSQIAALPWPERTVYFLRGVLHYSCQEIAHLISLTDVQIDQLYKFAAKRLGYENHTTCR